MTTFVGISISIGISVGCVLGINVWLGIGVRVSVGIGKFVGLEVSVVTVGVSGALHAAKKDMARRQFRYL